MASLKTYFSVFSLNVNGLNALIKHHRVADWIKRHDPSIFCLKETHFVPKDTFRLKVRDGIPSFMPVDLKRKLR